MKFQGLILSGVAFFSICGLAAEDQFPTVKNAAMYDNHSRQQWDVAFEALKQVELKGSERVLDIGCGTGKITANLAGRVDKGSVLGLDLSEGMIAFAQRTYQPFYPNLSFVQEDIFSFNASSEFDLIFSASSLHWILDHKRLLDHVYNLLNEQGSILFTIPCTPSTEVGAVFRDVTSQEPWKSYLNSYSHPRRKFTSEEYTLLLSEAGFKDIEVVQVPFTYTFETKREFAAWYAAFSPMLLYIPHDLHKSFLTSLVDSYLKSFPLDEEGQVIFKQNELIIRAVKGSR